MATVVWITGLPGSGKSTLAKALKGELHARGWPVYTLDGDVLRDRLCSDLGFSPKDRNENVRRVAEVAAMFAALDDDMVVIAAFISPHEAGRKQAREAVTGYGFRFVEVYLCTPLMVCEERDPKGHYRRARKGEMKNFTGVSAPYEQPSHPDLIVDTSSRTIESCIASIRDVLAQED